MPEKNPVLGQRPRIDTRPAAHRRGYDHKWRVFRDAFFRNPDNVMCKDCAEDGIHTEATEIHHIKKVRDYPKLRLVRNNCLGLCKKCHSIRTSRGE